MLSVRNLHTHFLLGKRRVARAVDGVSFDIERGETVCLVGESGCGKSVTAFSVLQLLPRNAVHPAGEIRFHGQDILTMRYEERQRIRGNQISMIFQEPGSSLNPVLTVGRQVAESLLRHRRLSPAEARRRTIERFAEVGIPHPSARFDAYPHELSGGMKQRVMIAMALACEPELLIADEPTTALDVTIQAQILNLIRRLQAEHHMAVLLITHNLRVVNQVADRVLVMYAGQLVEEAERRALFRRPRHPYTQRLLQAIPGTAARGQRLSEIPGRVPSAVAFPDGCRFADRCPFCLPRCRASTPPLVEVDAGHRAACLRAEDPEVAG